MRSGKPGWQTLNEVRLQPRNHLCGISRKMKLRAGHASWCKGAMALKSVHQTVIWLRCAAFLVVLPGIGYCLLALPAHLSRFTASHFRQHAAMNLPRPDLTREMDLLAKADPFCTAFERATHAPIYVIDTLRDTRYSYNVTGTTSVVINKARLPSVELRTLAISHELYHAAHRFHLYDLVFPEESQAHLHTRRTAAALHVHAPTEEDDTVIIFAPTVLLALAFLSAIALWLTHPTFAEYRRVVYKP